MIESNGTQPVHIIGDLTAVLVFGNEAGTNSSDEQNESRRLETHGRERPLVLVADDEPLIVRTLVEILQGEGYDAIGARDGLEAVSQARTSKPDILVFDVVMPRLNGIEAATRIRAFLPDSRIVLFSGQASSMELLEDAHADVQQFEIVAKPIKPAELLKIIRRLSQ